MSMVFPGMDPYLEEPRIWQGLHASLVVYIADTLQPRLRPRYLAAVEERVYLEGPQREIISDVWLRQSRASNGNNAGAVVEADAPVLVEAPPLEIHERYIEILDRQSGMRVVTIIEVVSPANKYAGRGRNAYVAKQAEVQMSSTHLVELDSLRTGPHVLAVPEWLARGRSQYDYLVCVNRDVGPRWKFELYLRRLRESLPRIRIPLAAEDPDVVLDVQAVLAHTYEAGSYRDRLAYRAACCPGLAPEDQAWADELIREAAAQTAS